MPLTCPDCNTAHKPAGGSMTGAKLGVKCACGALLHYTMPSNPAAAIAVDRVDRPAPAEET